MQLTLFDPEQLILDFEEGCDAPFDFEDAVILNGGD